jgi:endogenous inhibitor of DNA gyrase (YacG/DUF329 family)
MSTAEQRLRCPICNALVERRGGRGGGPASATAGAAASGAAAGATEQGAAAATARTGPDPFPFCSPRCRTIDLGKWLSGDYRIPSAPTSESDLEALAESASATGDDPTE